MACTSLEQECHKNKPACYVTNQVHDRALYGVMLHSGNQTVSTRILLSSSSLAMQATVIGFTLYGIKYSSGSKIL